MKDLHARRPVNREAAKVVSGSDCSGGSDCSSSRNDDLALAVPVDPNASETPIPTTQIPRGHRNLIGLRQGRFVVVGYWGRNNSVYTGTAARYRWVVRCDCGMYTIRRETSLLTERPGRTDACNRCAYLAHLRWIDTEIQKGRGPIK